MMQEERGFEIKLDNFKSKKLTIQSSVTVVVLQSTNQMTIKLTYLDLPLLVKRWLLCTSECIFAHVRPRKSKQSLSALVIYTFWEKGMQVLVCLHVKIRSYNYRKLIFNSKPTLLFSLQLKVESILLLLFSMCNVIQKKLMILIGPMSTIYKMSGMYMRILICCKSCFGRNLQGNQILIQKKTCWQYKQVNLSMVHRKPVNARWSAWKFVCLTDDY